MLARSGDRSLLGCRLLSVFSQAEGLRELREISFIKALIPFSGAPPSGPNHLPKAPSPHTITLRKQFQHINGGGGHTHSVYSSLFKKTRLEVRLLFLKLKLDDKLK